MFPFFLNLSFASTLNLFGISGVPAYYGADANSSRGGLMKDMQAGKIYHSIMYGLNAMGSHASQLSPDERWKVVMYVQQLQKTQ